MLSVAAVVALGRVRNYLEYRRLPEWLVPAIVHELLGVLHIRSVAGAPFLVLGGLCGWDVRGESRRGHIRRPGRREGACIAS
jgi:hypothetical protein